MRREHPILFSALVGGVTGLLVALIMALSGPYTSLSPAVIYTLWPASILGFGYNGSSGFTLMSIVMPTVELGGNAFIYAVAAAVPTALIVGIRDFFIKKDGHPLSIKPD
jgi:hypothetical protein